MKTKIKLGRFSAISVIVFTFLCIKKFRMMSMIQARASTFTVRNNIYNYNEKKNQSTNKKTSCYYYESFSLSFPVPFVASDFLDHRVSPRPIASPFINNFKVFEFQTKFAAYVK